MGRSLGERRQKAKFIPKKRSARFGRSFEGWIRGSIAAAVLLLVTGIAVSAADGSSTCSADGRAFEGVSGLMADYSAKDCAAKGSGCCTALGVRSDWCCAVGERKGGHCTDKG